MTGWPAQAFRLSASLIDSISEEEVKATYADMSELGLANPPYDEYDIIVPEQTIIKVKDRPGKSRYDPDSIGYEMILRYRGPIAMLMIQDGVDRHHYRDIIEVLTKIGVAGAEFDDYLEQTGAVLNMYRVALIVLLATKNTEKIIKQNKLKKLGIGSKEKHDYVTTLKIGAITEQTETSDGTGLTRRPHLRRGHIRRQHYGPENTFIKQIWISPVFVNADEGWIASRTAYNVSTQRAKP